MKEAVIIANGRFPKHEIPLQILKKASYLICCDGAIRHLERKCIQPDIIIGDLDSIFEKQKVKYQDIIVQVADQETNDLTKAVNFALSKGFKKVTILGATGKREDHTIGNISLLVNYAKSMEVIMVSDYGIWTPALESRTFKSYKGQQVSIYTFHPEVKLISENLKYPLNEYKIKYWWEGTLNESLQDSFHLNFSGEIIVFQTH